MYIDINKIGPRGLMVEDNVTMEDSLLIEEGGFFLENLSYSVFFTREGEKVRVRGHIRTRVSLRCVSCLENFELPVDSKFDLIMFPIRMEKAADRALNASEMEYIFFDGDGIDLVKVLMEQVNLFLPFNPVCGGDCKGICSKCGSNLNYESCQCETSCSDMGVLIGKLKSE